MTSSQARKTGARGPLSTAALVLLALGPVAYLSPALAVLCLGAVCGVAAILVQRRLTALGLSQDKLSSEIDVISQHILKVEALARATVDRVRILTPGGGATARPVAEARATDEPPALAGKVEAITAEIDLLGGLVRDLADVLSAQERELERLRDALATAGSDIGALKTIAATPRPEAAEPIAADKASPTVPTLFPPTPVMPDRAREQALIRAFDADGLEVWLQPIVTLPQRKVVSYEALARLRIEERDGSESVLAAESFIPVLERHGRTTALDRRMLGSVATIARHLKVRASAATLAYALSPLSLYEPDFLRLLVSIVDEEPELADRLLIALPQTSWRNLDEGQNALLAALRGRIGFVLDRPCDLRFEANDLAERGIAYLKIPASLLLRPASGTTLPDIAIEDLAAALGRSGLRLIAGEVEADADVAALIELDVPLAQGGVFAAPRAVRAEVFAAAPASMDAPADPAAEPGQPPLRRPFRDFLRRAV